MTDDFSFDEKLDKITEREVVYDFFSRLSLGLDFIDPNNTVGTIFNKGTNVKQILEKITMSLPTSLINNLKCANTAYTPVNIGDTIISVTLPKNSNLIKVYSENTQIDLTSLFSHNDDYSKFTMTVDTPYTNTDIIKFYYNYSS